MKVECFKDLVFFLCLVYVFICIVFVIFVFLCCFFCESVRNGCEEFMKCFGFIWLEFLCCEKFFKLGDEICVGENIMSGNG